MPTYSGGKARFGREIVNKIIQLEKEQNWIGKQYFEPFCGMLGTVQHISKMKREVVANDINTDIILMWENLKSKQWNLPTSFSKEIYSNYKKSNIHSAERGFYGIACAYSGIFFAGFRSQSIFFQRARNSIQKISNHLESVHFFNKSFTDFEPENMTIYCDPPYRNNRFGSQFFNKFDTELFWNTVRKWSQKNLVIISEYEAPYDFECIWEKSIKSTFRNKTTIRTEKLFVHQSTFHKPI